MENRVELNIYDINETCVYNDNNIVIPVNGNGGNEKAHKMPV